MTIERFRDVADMPPPQRCDPKDPATYARIRELWHFSSQRLPPLFAAGVYRYRSMEESERAREHAVIERMRALRLARTTAKP